VWFNRYLKDKSKDDEKWTKTESGKLKKIFVLEIK
jgi:hypothetical protein